MIKLAHTLLLAFAVAILPGCSSRIAQFTMISNRDIDVRALEHRLPLGKTVKGESSRLTQLIIFPTFMSPSIEEAVDNALKAGNGDLLIHVNVEQELVWIPYLITTETIRVEGTVVDTKGGGRR